MNTEQAEQPQAAHETLQAQLIAAARSVVTAYEDGYWLPDSLVKRLARLREVVQAVDAVAEQ